MKATLALVLTAALLVVACLLSLGLYAENALLKDRNRRLEDQNALLATLAAKGWETSNLSVDVAAYCDEVLRSYLEAKGLGSNLERLP